MSISSMTGFARAQGTQEALSWTWELKSVNGKGLDLRAKVPPGFEAVEASARERLRRRLGRGNVFMALSVNDAQGRGRMRINEEVLAQVLEALPTLRAHLPDAAEPGLDGLLALRGVLEPVEETRDEEAQAALVAAILDSLDTALSSLVAVRAEEGTRLEGMVMAHLDVIDELRGEAARHAETQPDAIHTRLKEQVEELLAEVPALPEERLAQEAALLMVKADIREELDRLRAHGEAARDLLRQGGTVGRKLDFLCQEFNREANTLCSKSSDVALTRIGLDLKAAIDQLREQVQNIE